MQSEQFQLHAQIEQRHWWFVARRQILADMVSRIAPAQSPIGHLTVQPPVLPGGGVPLDCPSQTVVQPPVEPGANKASGVDGEEKCPGGQPIVVDIGCGTGANLAALAGDYLCVGIDTSAEAIELARQRFPGITFVCGQAPRDVDRFLAKADVVLLTDVLEHVPVDRGLLAAIVEACRPGAKLLITVPADMRLWSPHDEVFGHFRRYTADSLAEIWSGLPVKPRLVSYFNTRLYPLVRAARSINRRRGKTSGAANTDFKIPARPVNWLLERIFAQESRRLLSCLDKNQPAFSYGVSLIAVLERQNSRIASASDWHGGEITNFAAKSSLTEIGAAAGGKAAASTTAEPAAL
ncbi:MAG TPA: class I SAM-dependent methyltransferase [Pirellulales bacterium]|jgi:SAM-dependent methyltransferase